MQFLLHPTLFEEGPSRICILFLNSHCSLLCLRCFKIAAVFLTASSLCLALDSHAPPPLAAAGNYPVSYFSLPCKPIVSLKQDLLVPPISLSLPPPLEFNTRHSYPKFYNLLLLLTDKVHFWCRYQHDQRTTPVSAECPILGSSLATNFGLKPVPILSQIGTQCTVTDSYMD